MHFLLSPDVLQRNVFLRDGRACVVCGETNEVRVQQLLDSRLWPDGGYYLANAVTLCTKHHAEAEKTRISVQELRNLAGIKEIITPPQLNENEDYDKWGNPILPNKTRLRGELFHEEECQKALADGEVLHLFSKYVKYPRTLHLPWSPNLQNDDRRMEDISGMKGQEVVVTLKMDGENTSCYRDHVHARSLDSGSHEESFAERLRDLHLEWIFLYQVRSTARKLLARIPVYVAKRAADRCVGMGGHVPVNWKNLLYLQQRNPDLRLVRRGVVD